MNKRISEKDYIKNQVHNVLQQSASRKDRYKPVYLFHSTIKTCVYGVICFIISGILCIQEVQTEEVEGGLFKDKILELLEKIPQSTDNLYIGPLRIHPSLEISQTYDDNVFYSASRDLLCLTMIGTKHINLLFHLHCHSGIILSISIMDLKF